MQGRQRGRAGSHAFLALSWHKKLHVNPGAHVCLSKLEAGVWQWMAL
jgi:hypothetical protein